MLSACRPATDAPQSAEPLTEKTDSSLLQQGLAEDDLPSDSGETDYANFFVLLADTGQDYSTLQKRMFFLHNKLNWPIDTLGRYYDQNKGAVILPENDEDELYAGEYYPPAFPGTEFKHRVPEPIQR